MNENNKTVDYTQKVLDVKNLKKHFFVGVGKNKLRIPAVDDLTFSVYKREVFGLVGESGCGKTTTGRTLIKLYNATDGFVDLNGVRVVAGYESNINQIKKIKKEHNNQILALNENEFNIYKIKQKEKQQLKEIKYQQRILEQQFEGIKEEIEKPLSLHIDKLYDLKNQYRLDIEKLEFAFAQEKEKIENQTQNSKVVEYKNEVAIATNTYNNKKSGLKDSAALNQETIKERLESLIQEHEEHLKELEEKYSVLIENEKSVIISKADAKEQIAKLKAELNQQLAARRVEYNEAVGAVVAPNKAEIASKTAEQKAIYNQKNSELVAQSAQIKEAIKQEIAQLQLVEYTKEQLNQIKQQKNEINAKMKVLVAEQKAKIAEIKQINRSQSANNAARKMQMIFQDPISSLNPRMTVKEIVGEGLVIQGNHTKEEIDRKVSEALKTVGLAPEYATRYPHEFSGGQRQRIGIARALIMNPNFIIADEPISALDVSIRAQVINLLTELKDELGLTILFIAHDLSVVRFFCDRIAVMFSGKIVELADSEELFNNPLHPYTVSLLSAIPQPDPHYEKGRKRISYNPSIHDYRNDKPELVEVKPGHFVYANKKELEEINQKLASSKVEDKPAQDETLEPKPAKAKPKPKAKTAPKKKQNNQ